MTDVRNHTYQSWTAEDGTSPVAATFSELESKMRSLVAERIASRKTNACNATSSSSCRSAVDAAIGTQARKRLRSDSRVADDGSEEEMCSICFRTWSDSGDHRLCSLACGHFFGSSCVYRWLSQHAQRCPTCNCSASLQDVRIHYGHPVLQQELSSLQFQVERLQAELERAKEELKTYRVPRTVSRASCWQGTIVLQCEGVYIPLLSAVAFPEAGANVDQLLQTGWWAPSLTISGLTNSALTAFQDTRRNASVVQVVFEIRRLLHPTAKSILQRIRAQRLFMTMNLLRHKVVLQLPTTSDTKVIVGALVPKSSCSMPPCGADLLDGVALQPSELLCDDVEAGGFLDGLMPQLGGVGARAPEQALEPGIEGFAMGDSEFRAGVMLVSSG